MIKFIVKKMVINRLISILILTFFSLTTILPPSYAQVVSQTYYNLPTPGTMLAPTPAYAPAVIRGLMIYPDNPLKFDFVIDRGDDKLSDDAFKTESTKLVRYFLASLTVPEKDMWVNLSPYEKNRIVPENFGRTEMGRDLLAQDYILKQLTASLMYPENETGKEFWNNVYAKIHERFGMTDIPLDTFNKVWIVPDKTSIYEHAKGAFIVKGRLKVMLEEDYVAMANNSFQNEVAIPPTTKQTNDKSLTATIQSQMVREIIIPALEKEVNEGKTFTQLRQIYYSMILASWYKKALKESLLGKVYVDQSKTEGVDIADKDENQKIYEKYLEAFKKGAYDYVKEDYNPETQEIVTRKYISGGVALDQAVLSDETNPEEINQAVGDMAALANLTTVELSGGNINRDVAVTADNSQEQQLQAEQNWKTYVEDVAEEYADIEDRRITGSVMREFSDPVNNSRSFQLNAPPDSSGVVRNKSVVGITLEEFPDYLVIKSMSSRTGFSGNGYGEELIKQILEQTGKPIRIVNTATPTSVSNRLLKLMARLKALGYPVTPLKDSVVEGNNLGDENLSGKLIFGTEVRNKIDTDNAMTVEAVDIIIDRVKSQLSYVSLDDESLNGFINKLRESKLSVGQTITVLLSFDIQSRYGGEGEPGNVTVEVTRQSGTEVKLSFTKNSHSRSAEEIIKINKGDFENEEAASVSKIGDKVVTKKLALMDFAVSFLDNEREQLIEEKIDLTLFDAAKPKIVSALQVLDNTEKPSRFSYKELASLFRRVDLNAQNAQAAFDQLPSAGYNQSVLMPMLEELFKGIDQFRQTVGGTLFLKSHIIGVLSQYDEYQKESADYAIMARREFLGLVGAATVAALGASAGLAPGEAEAKSAVTFPTISMRNDPRKNTSISGFISPLQEALTAAINVQSESQFRDFKKNAELFQKVLDKINDALSQPRGDLVLSKINDILNEDNLDMTDPRAQNIMKILSETPGLYYLNDFDPQKPVLLFIHGSNGSSMKFNDMISKLGLADNFNVVHFVYSHNQRPEIISNQLNASWKNYRQDVMTSDYAFGDRIAYISYSYGTDVIRTAGVDAIVQEDKDENIFKGGIDIELTPLLGGAPQASLAPDWDDLNELILGSDAHITKALMPGEEHQNYLWEHEEAFRNLFSNNILYMTVNGDRFDPKEHIYSSKEHEQRRDFLLNKNKPQVFEPKTDNSHRDFPYDVEVQQSVLKAITEFFYPPSSKDAAMAGNVDEFKKGGIDFNPENLKMNVKKVGDGVQFKAVSDQSIQNMDIKGFVPVIINVTPATNLPLLLGIKTGEKKENMAYSS